MKKRKKPAVTSMLINKLIAPVLFVFILSVYLLTLAPTIGFRDSGDMVTASYLLGISHPSGFPLYMLIGKAFSFMPVSEIAFRYNLMSALFGALAVILVFFSVKRLLKSSFISAIVSLMLAFSVTFWAYSIFAEKYSLYAFFAALLIWLVVNLREKTIPLIVFILGLALTHHLAIVAFVLPVLFLLFLTGKKCYNPKKWLFLSLLFLLPLLLYLYLPLRASATPLKWGTPDTIEKIINHISAKDYRYAMFTAAPVSIFKKLYLHLIKNYVNEFTPGGFLLLLLGLWRIYIERARIGYFLPGNYATVDMKNYFADYNFGKNILKTVEEDSVMVVNGDLPIFSLWYLEFAQGYDRSIEIIPGNMLVLPEFLKQNYGKKNIFLNYFPFESALWTEHEIAPFGMMYRIEKKGVTTIYDKVKVDALWSSYKGLNGSGTDKNSPGYEREKMTLEHYAWAMTMQGEFYLKNRFYSDASLMFEKALSIYPTYMEALISMGRLAELSEKNYDMAKKYYDGVLLQNKRFAGKNTKDSRAKVVELLKMNSEMFASRGFPNKAAYYLMKKNTLENNR